MSQLFEEFGFIEDLLFDHADKWQDRPDVMAFVQRFVVLVIALIERLSNNGNIKSRMVDEIQSALDAYQETLKGD